MRATIWLVAVVVGLLSLGATGAGQHQSNHAGNPSADEKAIESRLAEIQDAAQRLDPDRVFSFVLENDKGALVEDGKVFLTRAAALKSTRQGFKGLRNISYRFDQQHITLLSPTVALAVGEGVSSATTNDGRDFSTRFAQSVVLMKSDGEWKVTHAHRSFPATK